MFALSVRAVARTTLEDRDYKPVVDAFSRAVAIEDYSMANTLSNGFLHQASGAFRPWAHLMRASLVLAEQIDYGDTLRTGLFNTHLDSIRSELSAENGPADSNRPRRDAVSPSDRYYLLGMVESLEAQRWNEVKNDPLKALGPARRSAALFKQSLELEPERADARLNLALYEFWRSHALRFLAWTPLVADKRPEALETLEHIAHSDDRSRYAAGISLAWALIEMDRPLDAAALADSMLAALGEVRGLLEPCGKAYFLSGRWGEARNRYDRLVASIRSAPRRNLVRETGALHRLAHIAKSQGDWPGVIAYADQALALPLNEKQLERKHDDRERLKKLRREAVEKLEH